MIAVHHHFAVRNVGHGIDRDVRRIVIAGSKPLELHAHGHVCRKAVLRFHAHQLAVVFTECVLRLQRHRRAFAYLFGGQRLLDFGKYAVIAAMQITYRIGRFFDQLTVRVEKTEIQGDYSIREHIHGRPPGKLESF